MTLKIVIFHLSFLSLSDILRRITTFSERQSVLFVVVLVTSLLKFGVLDPVVQRIVSLTSSLGVLRFIFKYTQSYILLKKREAFAQQKLSRIFSTKNPGIFKI